VQYQNALILKNETYFYRAAPVFCAAGARHAQRTTTFRGKSTSLLYLQKHCVNNRLFAVGDRDVKGTLFFVRTKARGCVKRFFTALRAE
jgi:hypothetical protein